MDIKRLAVWGIILAICLVLVSTLASGHKRILCGAQIKSLVAQ